MGQIVTVRRSVTDLLAQDKVWQPAGSEAQVRLEDMAASHRLNLARWLKRNAPALHTKACMEALEWSTGPFAPRGEMATMAMEEAQDEIWGTAPLVYVRSSPLWIRLNLLIRRDFAVLRADEPLEVTF